MSNDPQPVFPQELERNIFLLSLHDNLDDALNILLVAHRVYHWLLPEVFDVVILISGPPPWARFNHSPYGIRPSKADLMRHGKYVHHLLLSDASSDDLRFNYTPEWCLSQCPNITDLAFWDGSRSFSPEIITQLFSLRHLTHLSFRLYALAEGLKKSETELPQPFTFVTHLEILSLMDDYTPTMIKTFFPSLTHLAFIGGGYIPNATQALESYMDVFKDTLKVLIWSPGLGKNPRPETVQPTTFTPPNDPRFFAMRHGNDWTGTWAKDARGDAGMWGVADEIVQARSVPPLQVVFDIIVPNEVS